MFTTLAKMAIAKKRRFRYKGRIYTLMYKPLKGPDGQRYYVCQNQFRTLYIFPSDRIVQKISNKI